MLPTFFFILLDRDTYPVVPDKPSGGKHPKVTCWPHPDAPCIMKGLDHSEPLRTMKLKSLANWAEIVGAITVVVSLLSVGYQVRQNTDAV